MVSSSIPAGRPTGSTNSPSSSSGVRVTPAGCSRVRRSEGAELVGAAQHLFDRVHDGGGQALAAPILAHRHGFHVPAAQRGVAVEQPALDHRGMRDQGAVVTDEGVHATERVLPVGVAEITLERLDDHAAGALSSLLIEIGGVDESSGVQDPASNGRADILERHTLVLPAPRAGVCTCGPPST